MKHIDISLPLQDKSMPNFLDLRQTSKKYFMLQKKDSLQVKTNHWNTDHYSTYLLDSFIMAIAIWILLRRTRTINRRMTNKIVRKIPGNTQQLDII